MRRNRQKLHRKQPSSYRAYNRKISEGTKLTELTAAVLSDVRVKAGLVNESIAKIEQASLEQTAAIEQVKKAITEVSAVVQTNAATAEENSATSEEMSVLRPQPCGVKLQNLYYPATNNL